MKKNVSVIIPTYNRAHVLHKTIPSYIQNITLEIIIVDDGSKDYTRNVVRHLHQKYPQIKYIGLKKHRGLPYAKNIGVKRAKGNYIYFGDDDACLYQGTLLRLRDALEKFPADIAGANGSYATDINQILHMDKYIEQYFVKPFQGRCIVDFNSGKFDYNYKIEEITEGLFVMSCFMIRSECTKEIQFDIGYIGNAAREDMDYLLQQAKYGRKMVYVPDAYEIDIPRSIVKKGGSHDYKLWEIVIFTIRNHYYFLKKHYDYLKQEGYVSVSCTKAKILFLKDIIVDLIEPIIKRLKNVIHTGFQS